jgi:hypothetical protein
MKIATKLAAVVLCALALPSAASAAVIITSISYDSGSLTGTIRNTATGLKIVNASVGRFKLSGTDSATLKAVQFLSYCVDITQYIHTGSYQTPALSTLVSNPLSGSKLTTGRLNQLVALVENAELLVNAATGGDKRDKAAALQLAVWEIIYESSTGASYNINNGKFYVTGTSAHARSIANDWLGKISDGAANAWHAQPNKQVNLLSNPRNQSQIYLGPVPEPGTWSMLIAGFGLIGGLARRRRVGHYVVS